MDYACVWQVLSERIHIPYASGKLCRRIRSLFGVAVDVPREGVGLTELAGWYLFHQHKRCLVVGMDRWQHAIASYSIPRKGYAACALSSWVEPPASAWRPRSS